MSINKICENCSKKYETRKKSQKFCSRVCKGENRFKQTIRELKTSCNINDLEKWLYQNYIIEKKTFRQIMNLLDTKNNRIISKLLDYYSIPIRYSSEAIKTQWFNNDNRRKQQAEIFRKSSMNNTRRRLDFAELQEKYLEKDMKVLKREFIEGRTRVVYECLRCGEVSDQLLDSIRGCSYCHSNSRGEDAIVEYLNQNNIDYEYQYRISECRNVLPLPFDFAISNSHSLMALIEYQGIQHYQKVEHWGGIEGFEERKRNDKIKKDYCKARGIKLIEIPYTIENIEKYLKQELNDLNSTLQLSIL